MVKFFYSAVFLKNIKRLSKKYKSFKDDLSELYEQLAENPYLGTDLGSGARKIRMSIKSKGKGKSGGARVITFLVSESEDSINLTFLTVYDKSEQENISDKTIDAIVQSFLSE